MSDFEIKQTLVSWALIELLDGGGQTRELLVWGEPEGDPNRFKLTSSVREIVDETPGDSCLVYTQNSVYRVRGSGSHYRLPLVAYEMLSQGHAPDYVTTFYKPVAKPARKPGGPIGPLFSDSPDLCRLWGLEPTYNKDKPQSDEPGAAKGVIKGSDADTETLSRIERVTDTEGWKA